MSRKPSQKPQNNQYSYWTFMLTRECAAVHRQTFNICWCKALNKSDPELVQGFEPIKENNSKRLPILSADVCLQHMRDIENTDMVPSMPTRFLDVQVRILHWHLITRERHHFSIVFLVQVIETGSLPEHCSRQWMQNGRIQGESRGLLYRHQHS